MVDYADQHERFGKKFMSLEFFQPVRTETLLNLIGMVVFLLGSLFMGGGLGCRVDENTKVKTPRIARADATSSKKNDVLKIRLPRDLPTLNPLESSNFDVWRLTFPWVMEPLLKVEKKTGKMVGVLAESWKPLKTKGEITGYRFTLREGVYWHDGKALTPKDVMFTMGLVTTGELRPAKVIKKDQYNSLISRMKRNQLPVQDVKILGGNVFEIHLSIPYGPFLERLAQVPIAPRHLFQECGLENNCPKKNEQKVGEAVSFCKLSLDLISCTMAGKMMIGTGPFKVLQWWPGEKIIFLRNDDYWGRAPKAKRLEFHILAGKQNIWKKLKEGVVDIIAGVNGNELHFLNKKLSDKKTGENNFRVVNVKPHGTTFAVFRGTRNRFLRRALWLLINRKDLLSMLPGGTGEKMSLLAHPVSHDSYQQEVFPGVHYGAEPKAAFKLLERVGWKRGPKKLFRRGGGVLKIKVVLPEGAVVFGDFFKKTASDLRKHGIVIDVEKIPHISYITGLAGKRVSGKYASLVQSIGWGNVAGSKAITAMQVAYVSPWTDLYEQFHSSRRSTFAHSGVPRDVVLDELLEKWALETDRKKRLEVTSKVMERLWQLAAVLPLQPPVYPLVVSSRVKGIRDGGMWMDLGSLELSDEGS